MSELLFTSLAVPICAVLGGCCAEICTSPIEITKVRIQLSQGNASISSIISSIYSQNGILGFWNGIKPSLARQVLCCSAKFSTYEPLKQHLSYKFPQKDNKPSFWHMLVAGGVSGLTMGLVANPVDLLKTRMQSGLNNSSSLNSSISRSLYDIMKNEGILSIWKGVIPMVQRSFFVTMAELTIYDASKRKIRELGFFPEGSLVHASASFSAGFGAALVSTPIDLAKNRLMTSGLNGVKCYTGMSDVFQQMLKENGIMSLYRGFIPTWMRIGPWAIVMFMTYEKLIDILVERKMISSTLSKI
mmetsp:Transcript_6102/g.9157  ORF Transcript_6102/g.9157 Transcript_6102/m.9157 type:complete len:301 (-) Transcript_6102:20-922(-)